MSVVAFVKVDTDDFATRALVERIEKICMLQQWVQKARSHLQDYLSVFREAEEKRDYADNLKIRQCEAHFMTSITCYLRCFHDQPTYHLVINQITDNEELLDRHQQLLDLRNDEFVHWKGVRSEAKAYFSFEVEGPYSMIFAEKMKAFFKEEIGPDKPSDQTFKLFDAADEYLKSRRVTLMQKLRKKISDPEVTKQTILIDQFEQVRLRGVDRK